MKNEYLLLIWKCFLVWVFIVLLGITINEKIHHEIGFEPIIDQSVRLDSVLVLSVDENGNIIEIKIKR